MIDTVLNLLFRCPHKRLTRPVTPVSKAGVPHGDTYVVCLDCGKQFHYDLKEMRVLKPVAVSQTSGVLRPDAVEKHPKSRIKYAVWAAVPVAWFVSKAVRKHPPERKPPSSG